MNCANAGWSAVTSAQANATLAGVLAGFMLNGIVVLLSRMMTEFAKVRTLALLFTAFVALGLDSYLFGLVTGDSECHRAWSEAMLAAGLLGMGAVAIIAGFGFQSYVLALRAIALLARGDAPPEPPGARPIAESAIVSGARNASGDRQ